MQYEIMNRSYQFSQRVYMPTCQQSKRGMRVAHGSPRPVSGGIER